MSNGIFYLNEKGEYTMLYYYFPKYKFIISLEITEE